MSRSVPLSLSLIGRRLLLVPVLILSMYVVLVDATAAPPADRGAQVENSRSDEHRVVTGGDSRRMR